VVLHLLVGISVSLHTLRLRGHLGLMAQLLPLQVRVSQDLWRIIDARTVGGFTLDSAEIRLGVSSVDRPVMLGRIVHSYLGRVVRELLNQLELRVRGQVR